jgi:hypothetical protein
LTINSSYAQDFPSCHNKTIGINQISKNHFFVVIDQTTQLNPQIVKHVSEQVLRFIDYGNTVTIIAFSAYSQNRYMQIIGTTKIESLIEKNIRDDMPRNQLKAFDNCMETQLQKSFISISNNLKDAILGIDSKLLKSDIFFSLKEISFAVSASKAQNKTVLIVSDMLENSSISSFYLSNSVKLINPDQEIKNVEKNVGFGNFSGSNTYVIGAGWIMENPKSEESYRNPKIMQALKMFWTEFFQKSNSKLVEFGMPMLLNSISAK